jgi:hypothetical protein
MYVGKRFLINLGEYTGNTIRPKIYKVLAKKVLEKYPLERPRVKWVGSINMDRKLMIPAQHRNDCAGENRKHIYWSGLDRVVNRTQYRQMF